MAANSPRSAIALTLQISSIIIKSTFLSLAYAEGGCPIRYTLRIQMILINLLISVVPLIMVGVISYSINLHNAKKNVSQTVDMLFVQVNSRIAEYFDEINSISKSVFLNKSLQTIHQVEEANWTKYTWIQDHLNAYLETNQSIKGIYWKDNFGNVFSTQSAAGQCGR